MSVKQIYFCVSAVLMQINAIPARRTFGNSVAVVGGDGFSSVGVINQGSNLKIYDEHGNVHVVDDNKKNNLFIIGDDAANVKVINPGKGKGFGNVKVIEGAGNNNVVYFGDGGNSMVMVGNGGGGFGMVGGGVSVGNFGDFGKSGSVSVFNGASTGPRGVSMVSTGPGVFKSSHASISPFGTGAFAGAGAGAGAGIGAYQDANNLLNFVTSATGMGMPFFPF